MCDNVSCTLLVPQGYQEPGQAASSSSTPPPHPSGWQLVCLCVNRCGTPQHKHKSCQLKRCRRVSVLMSSDKLQAGQQVTRVDQGCLSESGSSVGL